jgi:hypothetical protein
MVVVVAGLLADEEEDDEAARHPDGQAHDVDERRTFVLFQAPQGDFEVVSEHGRVSCQG